ncbi:metallophosphoesterase [Halomicroarcula sp. GCM10025710]
MAGRWQTRRCTDRSLDPGRHTRYTVLRGEACLLSYAQDQTDWITDNIGSENIAFVVHTGDLVDDGANPTQWNRIDGVIDTLDGDLDSNPDGLVPYAALPGDHDWAVEEDRSSSTENYRQYFGQSRYVDRSWFGVLDRTSSASINASPQAGSISFTSASSGRPPVTPTTTLRHSGGPRASWTSIPSSRRLFRLTPTSGTGSRKGGHSSSKRRTTTVAPGSGFGAKSSNRTPRCSWCSTGTST